jgi:hypothetical protein
LSPIIGPPPNDEELEKEEDRIRQEKLAKKNERMQAMQEAKEQ